MQHPFTVLAPEYTALLAQMKITRGTAVEAAAHRLISFIDEGRYKAGCDATQVPEIDAAASFEREAASNFRLSPAQGDPWDHVSVHVPRGIGPFASFTAAQIKSYQIDHLDAVGAANWSWERSCYEWELFNGFGYRARGVHTPYLWAGTSIYTRSKFTGDGVFDANAVDEQLGVIPMMFRIVELRPDLALPVAFPAAPMQIAAAVVPPPMATPVGLRDAGDVQRALNSLGCDPPLTVDDSYGRETRRAVAAFQEAVGLEADGIAGPETWLAINAQLRQASN
jgi:lysozyme family protein